jgi:hypothetical protein
MKLHEATMLPQSQDTASSLCWPFHPAKLTHDKYIPRSALGALVVAKSPYRSLRIVSAIAYFAT